MYVPRCDWLLLTDFRSLPTESWIIVCFPLDDLPSNAHRALFIHRPCTCSPARTSAWVQMMPSIHPVTTIKVTCSEEAVYWQGETYLLFSFYLHYTAWLQLKQRIIQTNRQRHQHTRRTAQHLSRQMNLLIYRLNLKIHFEPCRLS